MKRKLLSLVILMMTAVAATAQVSVAGVITSNMVLQRDRTVPVWGKAAPGERVTVTFDKQRMSVKASADGSWRADLRPMAASATPRTLTVKGKKDILTFDNVVVGEVWIASGQSNMQYAMRRGRGLAAPKVGVDSAEVELQKPVNPMIRVFTAGGWRPQPWAEASGESLPQVSAAGYFFAKKIQETLGIPVGIISAAVGGTPIEMWTSSDAYLSAPLFADEMRTTGKVSGWQTSSLYNSMIAPLIPFAIRGFIWYQGENNCGMGDRRYAAKQKVLVESWRKVFEVADAPFYYVLLGPHVYSDRMHRGTTEPMTAEMLPCFVAQQMAARDSVENSDFISVGDLIDDIRDIHPSYKWTVGARLANLALSETYRIEGIVCHGPQLSRIDSNGNSLTLTFDHAGDGLKAGDNKRLRWFEVAGDDGVFHAAAADIITPTTVKVFAPNVSNPRHVRYCQHEMAQPNLANSAGLPALPFESSMVATDR